MKPRSQKKSKSSGGGGNTGQAGKSTKADARAGMQVAVTLLVEGQRQQATSALLACPLSDAVGVGGFPKSDSGVRKRRRSSAVDSAGTAGVIRVKAALLLRNRTKNRGEQSEDDDRDTEDGATDSATDGDDSESDEVDDDDDYA